MLNCIFYSLFFVLFLNLSTGSLKLSQINRAFLSSYKGIYEASVITVGDDGEPIYPYFSQSLLGQYIHDFVEEKVTRYATNHELSYVFYKEDGVSECGEDDLARSIKIRLKADINYLFSYDKTQTFSIKDKESVWMKNY